MNKVVKEDIKFFAENFLLAKDFKGASFLVTGATGLIGKILVECLLNLEQNITITIPVRDKEKAEAIFGLGRKNLQIVECNLCDFLHSLSIHYDYIVHLASPTSGSYICSNPVETYEFIIETTRALLNYASKQSIKGFVYVSSLEYYGQNLDDQIINENYLGFIDMSSARSAYPMGKRAAEYLCISYALEKHLPIKIARLTQTFGAGVSKDDNRVFAQFAKSVILGKNIVLHTNGESSKPYCYTTDCVSAILYILLRGKTGEAYNVANAETYISIKELADFLCYRFNHDIKVVIEEHKEMGYAPTTKLHLSSNKLYSLGWRPHYNLYDMFNKLIEDIRQSCG